MNFRSEKKQDYKNSMMDPREESQKAKVSGRGKGGAERQKVCGKR